MNYLRSSVFFLANRLSKVSRGLAEFDKVMSDIEKTDPKDRQMFMKFQNELDEILAMVF